MEFPAWMVSSMSCILVTQNEMNQLSDTLVRDANLWHAYRHHGNSVSCFNSVVVL